MTDTDKWGVAEMHPQGTGPSSAVVSGCGNGTWAPHMGQHNTLGSQRESSSRALSTIASSQETLRHKPSLRSLVSPRICGCDVCLETD